MKQHLIYIVGAILIGIMVNVGAFYVLLVSLVYWFRFPKTYWIYFLITMGSFLYLKGTDSMIEIPLSNEIESIEARVIDVKQRTSDKQTVIINWNKEKLYVTLTQIEPKLIPGDMIQFEGMVQEPMNSTIPHGFDFKNYLNQQHINRTVTSRSFNIIGHQFTVKQWQYSLAEKIEKSFPDRTSSYMKAWLLGLMDGIGEEVQSLYSELGVIHLFSISGLHVSLLVLIMGYLLRRIGVIETITEIAMIVGLIGFTLISGVSVSVVRASGMRLLFILNHRLDWKLSSLDIFSILFIFNFILNPQQVYQLGFIYSYWLTAMLICFQSQLRQQPQKILFFYLPFIVQLMALPIQLYFNYYVNLYSYFANLVLIPLVSVLLLPLLMVTLVIPFFAPFVEAGLIILETSLSFLAPFFRLYWISGDISITIVSVLCMILLFTAFYVEKYKRASAWIICIGILFIIIEIQRMTHFSSKLTMLDVGQGDSFVIQSPLQQCNVVIDTGGKVSFEGERQSIFGNTLKPYLLGEGIGQIDYLILSHADFDHIGEVIPLLNDFKVKEILINARQPNEFMQEIIDVANRKGVKVRQVNPRDEVLCGNQKLTFLQTSSEKENENDASLIVLFEMDEFSAFLSGDISQKVEQQLIQEYHLPKVNLYKAAHHGSKTSNSKQLLLTLQPELILVSAGRKNRYGHPSDEVIQLAKELQIPLLATPDLGSIQVKIQKQDFKICSFPPYR